MNVLSDWTNDVIVIVIVGVGVDCGLKYNL